MSPTLLKSAAFYEFYPIPCFVKIIFFNFIGKKYPDTVNFFPEIMRLPVLQICG